MLLKFKNTQTFPPVIQLDLLYLYGYNNFMKYSIETTEFFDKWFGRLKDSQSKTRLLARFARMENGNFGDFKIIDEKISELRFFFGAGLRIYFSIKGNKIIILLNGGDKSSQKKDIKKAKQIFNELEI